MSVWASQSIQLAWFLAPNSTVDVEEFYRLLTDEEPETVQRNKSISQISPFLAMATGPMRDHKARIQFQPGRVDFLLMGSDPVPGDTMPLLDTAETLNFLRDKIDEVQTHLPASVRISIISNLVHAQPDYPTARKVLGDQISFDFGESEATDLLFQLNRRKLIRSGAVSINRVLKWSITAIQTFNINIADPGQQFSPHTAISEELFSTLNLDINTVVGQGTFSPKDQVPIFSEMIEEAFAIGSNRTVATFLGA